MHSQDLFAFSEVLFTEITASLCDRVSISTLLIKAVLQVRHSGTPASFIKHISIILLCNQSSTPYHNLMSVIFVVWDWYDFGHETQSRGHRTQSSSSCSSPSRLKVGFDMSGAADQAGSSAMEVTGIDGFVPCIMP
jgi:hypothetical protein